MKTLIPTEHHEQVQFIKWAEMMAPRYPELNDFYAVPNGGDRNVRVARKLKAEGVKPGVPDLVLPVPIGGYIGLYLELKRIKGGTLQNDQKKWLTRLQELGHCTCVCKGFAEALSTTQAYLSGNVVPNQYPAVKH